MPARDRPRLRRRSVEPDARLASVLGATKACARARKRDAPRAGACVDNLLAVRPLEGRDLLKGTHELGLQPRRVRRLWESNVNERSGERLGPARCLRALGQCRVPQLYRGAHAAWTRGVVHGMPQLQPERQAAVQHRDPLVAKRLHTFIHSTRNEHTARG